MKAAFLAILAASSVLVVQAGIIHPDSLSSRHVRVASARLKQLESDSIAEMSIRKRFEDSTPSVDVAPAKLPESSLKNSSDTHKTSSSSSSSNELINVQRSNCGPTGDTKKVTAVSGPNGNIDWLNCGINGAGWNPPYVRVTDINTVSLSSAIKQKGPFSACSSFVPLFEKYAKENELPAILLASFAMQESSCNPNAVGGGDEQGLMQLTQDKCGEAPGGNCKDPDYNIRTGTKFFADTLSDNYGDLLLSIGSYNGWFRGMTYANATAAANTGCCRCQNNLDYLQQFLNGWCQNIDAYTAKPPLGKYFNLNKCG